MVQFPLQNLLSGRELLLQEIPSEYHDSLYEAAIYTTKGIENGQCRRCGNDDERLLARFPHQVCGTECLYCRKCIMMGRVSACSLLYGWGGKPIEWNAASARLKWSGTLSSSQAEASKAIVQAVQNRSELLVWAVCGAGKTEMVFAGIEEALKDGKRVCIAAPRTDVILELEPRLKAVFPNMSVIALHGQSTEKHAFAPLVLSTVHQLLRYQDAFDVMIIDEVDAFPFSFDRSLQFAAEKAGKRNSTRIYLTATPSLVFQQSYKKGVLPGVVLPARFHRKPIPVPELRWGGNWQRSLRKGRIPAPLSSWLTAIIQKDEPFLIFFPHIALMEQALPLIKRMIPSIDSVHAEDPERREKVLKLRSGELQGLLTTTILERGVTIPRLNVAVIGAENEIFTEAALVQIAGRVGRSWEHPSGEVVFFHYGKTEEMLASIQQIIRMNEEAGRRGLLD